MKEGDARRESGRKKENGKRENKIMEKGIRRDVKKRRGNETGSEKRK